MLMKAGAVEGGVHVHRALLQRHGQCDGLVGGAGLVGVLIALVPPLLVLGVHPGVGEGLVVVLLRLIAAPVLLDGGQIRLQLRLEGLVVDGGEVAGVVVGVGGHGQDGAGLGVHHDAGAAVGGVELLQHALQALFQVVLDVGVQRQHQAAAVLRVEHLLPAAEEQRRAVDVGGGDGQAGAALEHVVIGGLQAVGAGVRGVDEAQHVPRQRPEGIEPLGVRRQVDALQPGGAPAGVGDEDGLSVRVDGGELVPLLVDLAVDEPPDLVGHVLVHLLLDVLMLRVGLFQVLQDGCLIHLQDAGEALCDVRLIPHRRGGVGLSLLGGLLRRLLDGLLLALHILLDPVGVDEHRLRGVGDGHDLAVLVVDGPPGGADDGAVGLLAHRPGLQVVVLEDLQVVQLPEQRRESRHAQQQHHQHGPSADHLVCPAGGVALASGMFGHGLSPPGPPGPDVLNTKARSKKAPFLLPAVHAL